MTTAELGMAFFDLAPEARLRMMANLLTKTNVPRNVRALYTRALVVADKIQSLTMMDYIFKDLMLRVSENEKRIKDFSNQFALELHRRGVMVHPSNIELWFVSTVHTQADIDTTLDAFEGAVKATQRELH